LKDAIVLTTEATQRHAQLEQKARAVREARIRAAAAQQAAHTAALGGTPTDQARQKRLRHNAELFDAQVVTSATEFGQCAKRAKITAECLTQSADTLRLVSADAFLSAQEEQALAQAAGPAEAQATQLARAAAAAWDQAVLLVPEGSPLRPFPLSDSDTD
jgi:hypothetical protein